MEVEIAGWGGVCENGRGSLQSTRRQEPAQGRGGDEKKKGVLNGGPWGGRSKRPQRETVRQRLHGGADRESSSTNGKGPFVREVPGKKCVGGGSTGKRNFI